MTRTGKAFSSGRLRWLCETAQLSLYSTGLVPAQIGAVQLAVPVKMKMQTLPSCGQMGGQTRTVRREAQPGKTENHRLPGLPKAGKMQTFLARVAHDFPQIQVGSLFKITPGGIGQAVPGREQGMAGEAEGGIVQTPGLKVLPGGQAFLCGKEIRQPSCPEQRAARALELPPARCPVVEDADAGIEAAVLGEFPCAGIGPAARNAHVTYALSDISGLLPFLP